MIGCPGCGSTFPNVHEKHCKVSETNPWPRKRRFAYILAHAVIDNLGVNRVKATRDRTKLEAMLRSYDAPQAEIEKAVVELNNLLALPDESLADLSDRDGAAACGHDLSSSGRFYEGFELYVVPLFDETIDQVKVPAVVSEESG